MAQVLQIHDTLEGAIAASHAAVDEGPDAVVNGLTGDDRSMLSNKGAIFSPWGWEVGRHVTTVKNAPRPNRLRLRCARL